MDVNRKFNRRNFFKGAGVAALGAGLTGLAQGASAQEMMNELPISFQRFELGDMGVKLMQENAFALPPGAFGAGAGEGELEMLLESHNLPTSAVNVSVTPIVLTIGDEVVLLDTGTGQNLLAGLSAIGVEPESVTRVVISHWHGDHVGGASANGALNFPNAMYHFPEADWNFLQEADSDGARASLAQMQPADDAGQLELYSAGELLSGLEAIAAPGHTPGQHAFLISSGDDSLMYTADVCNHHVASLIRPDWGFGFDADVALAAETRRAIFGRLADEGMRVVTYHFPFPGAGFVSREEDGFRFTPGS